MINVKTICSIAGTVLLVAAMGACSSEKSVKVHVDLPDDVAEAWMVELNGDSILKVLGSDYCVVRDKDGSEVVSQLTHDGLLIFQAGQNGDSGRDFIIVPSDTCPVYKGVAVGRQYPERADDVAWENELVGFRIYGPSTQRKGEKAFGYDIFFKHMNPEPVLEKLYEPETNPRTWEVRDSLLAISQQLADDFVRSISYHVDHGLGMDCYAVGPTLGAGVAAIVRGDSIRFPWCYETMNVLDNGPLRFSVRLDFAPLGENDSITEHRIISLDAGSYLNKTKVWFDGLDSQVDVAIGFPLRDDSPAMGEGNIVAYADPTQGQDNGKAMLGAVSPQRFDSCVNRQGHILGIRNIAPSDTLEYFWGFAWDKEDIKSQGEWIDYLRRFSDRISSPLVITHE